MNKPVRFIHIGDTHLRDDPAARMYGVNVYDAALKAVEAINSSTLPFDFVVHTGDVASVDGTQKEYELATKIFENIKVPMYFLTGNHDDAQLMRQILKFGEKKDLSADDTRLFYSFKIADHNFLVLDAKTTKEEDVIFLSNGVGYFSHVTINGPSIEIKQYAFENGVSSFIKTREEMLKSI